MSFAKYNSIENSYRDKFVRLVEQTPAYSDKWTITEKLHGANFSILYDGSSIQFAKRSGVISDGANFYGHEQMREGLESVAKAVYGELSLSGRLLTIYGELFGNGVQKGVRYGEKKFLSFDVSVDRVLLTQIEWAGLLTLPKVPILSTGCSFSEALAYNCEFDSLILGEPNNLAEGIVLKPNTPYFLECGSRIILKKKNEKFSERASEPKEKPEVPDFSDDETFSRLLSYINENRIKSVLSKETPSFKEFGRLNGLVLQDAIKDFEKDNEIIVKEYFGDKWNDAHKQIQGMSAQLLREELKRIC